LRQNPSQINLQQMVLGARVLTFVLLTSWIARILLDEMFLHFRHLCLQECSPNAGISNLTLTQYFHTFQDKKTPLHLAAEKGRIEVCQHLLELRADISAVDNVSIMNITPFTNNTNFT